MIGPTSKNKKNYEFHFLYWPIETDAGVWQTAVSTELFSFWRGISQPAETQTAAAEGNFIDCIAPHIYTLCIKVFVYYHHRKECLHSEIGTEKSKFVCSLVAITKSADMLNTDLDLVSDLQWQKKEFFKIFFSVSLCMCVWVCVCLCYSAVLSTLSALQSVKRLFFRWRQSWKDSNNWVYKTLILPCSSWLLSLSLL